MKRKKITKNIEKNSVSSKPNNFYLVGDEIYENYNNNNKIENKDFINKENLVLF